MGWILWKKGLCGGPAAFCQHQARQSSTLRAGIDRWHFLPPKLFSRSDKHLGVFAYPGKSRPAKSYQAPSPAAFRLLVILVRLGALNAART